ncbi:MAG: Trp biosynthesis-associated membrane protein, partial [Actinomycetes bacterium]
GLAMRATGANPRMARAQGIPTGRATLAGMALSNALVALAGGLAAAIAGRVARWVITGIIVLASVGIVAAAATVLANPLAAAQGSIAEATGITGSQAEVGVTAFPVLAVVIGCLLALAALLIPLAGRHWKARTKYDAPGAGSAAAAGPVDEIDSWDRLSRGDDPT